MIIEDDFFFDKPDFITLLECSTSQKRILHIVIVKLTSFLESESKELRHLSYIFKTLFLVPDV